MTLPAKPQPRQPARDYHSIRSKRRRSAVWITLLLVACVSTKTSLWPTLHNGWKTAASARALAVPNNIDVNEPLPFKVALYMTTHLNKEHVDFLTKCWPAALQRMPLLHQADLILYTSSEEHDDLFAMANDDDESGGAGDGGGVDTDKGKPKKKSWFRKQSRKPVGFHNVVIHRYQEDTRHQNEVPSKIDQYRQKQLGSISAVMAPYELRTNPMNKQLYIPKSKMKTISSTIDDENNPQNITLTSSWFDGYDWIVRLHPDVLLRRDDWLIQTMKNSSVDAILIDYDHQQAHMNNKKALIHSDFYAFRPHALDVSALLQNQQTQQEETPDEIPHAETHLYAGFEKVVQQKRVAWLPNVQRYRDWGRVTGPEADVLHWHDAVKRCPNYFGAHDGKHY